MNNDRFRFRAWIPLYQKGCMMYEDEDLFVKNGEACHHREVYGGMGEEYLGERIEPWVDAILMQCTGLKDSEGTLIWEGDVIRLDEVANRFVIWKDAQFVASQRIDTLVGACGPLVDRLRINQCKVIGNIYENPELINAHKNETASR